MIIGRVIHGEGIGKSQGYATANLLLPTGRTQLKSGVYAAVACFRDGQYYNSALIVTSQPHKVEIHLMDYDGSDFYGEEISVEPIQKVSEVHSADTMEELRHKIDDDLWRIQAVLSERKQPDVALE